MDYFFQRLEPLFLVWQQAGSIKFISGFYGKFNNYIAYFN